MPTLVSLIAIALAASPPLAACPRTVRLWEEVETADLIVVATVEEVGPTLVGRWLEPGHRLSASSDRGLWLAALAEMVPQSWRELPWRGPSLSRLVLRPSESWKGPLPRRLLLSLPEPAWQVEGVEGGEFLVFARRGLWGWKLDWWVRRAVFDSVGLTDLRRWVEEAVEVQRRARGSREARIDWLMYGVATPPLRDWAVFELTGELRRSRGREEEPAVLTRAQQMVIAAGFVADPPRGPSLVPTLQLLGGYDDPAVDRVLLGEIGELLSGEDLESWHLVALRLALDRLGAREALGRLAAETPCTCETGEIRRIWQLGVEEAEARRPPDPGGGR